MRRPSAIRGDEGALLLRESGEREAWGRGGRQRRNEVLRGEGREPLGVDAAQGAAGGGQASPAMQTRKGGRRSRLPHGGGRGGRVQYVRR